MREYVEHVATSPALVALAPERNRDNWLRLRASIAAREVADVYSLARLCTLAEFLSKRRETHHGPKWEVCIISGSALLERLLDSLKPHECGNDIFVLHPLSVMRFDKFLRPDSKPQQPYREGDTLVGGDDFALNAITSPETPIDSLDVDEFVRSLTRLLTSRSAAFAPLRDRSLHRMHTRLLVSSSFDQDHYLRTVRDVIARAFVQTYVQVNHLARSTSDCLSAINLPWLALPIRVGDESAAERYIQKIHDGQRAANRVKVAVPDAQIGTYFERIFADDSTGYTGMLCAALGYLAKGKEWIKAAETLANSAVVTAVEAPRPARSVETYMPEGNESLYLSAFISRMCVNPSVEYRDAARVWRNKHTAQMVAANERRQRWMNDRPSVANVASVGIPSLPRWRLVEMRYMAELIALEVFCWLIDILAPTDERLLTCDPENLLFRIGLAIEQVTDHEFVSSKSPELAFVRAQLVVASIQAWCCARASSNVFDREADANPSLVLERYISRLIFVSDVACSELVVGLCGIFERHATVRVDRRVVAQRSASQFSYRNFAAIDALRVPFFERLSRLARGSHFSLALPVQLSEGAEKED